jgi:hypothetical protein
MKLSNLTYSGPAISDPDIINEVPEAYRRLLRIDGTEVTMKVVIKPPGH